VNFTNRAIWRAAAPDAMRPPMTHLRDVGARVHLYDEEGGNVGVAHAPKPVVIGDVLAMEGATFRVTDVIDRIHGGNVDVLAVVEPARLLEASADL
jgi:hypothetical protein